MKYLKSYEMRYGVIYIKTCSTNEYKWLKYCYIFSSLPKTIQQDITEIANNINTKWENYIVIPMDIDINPGCTTKPEKVEEIATDMYNQYLKLAEKHGFSNTIRCVYSIGELSNVNVSSTHLLHHYDIMIKVGHFLDSSDEPGLFKI